MNHIACLTLLFWAGTIAIASAASLEEARARKTFDAAEAALTAGDPSRALDKFGTVIKSYRHSTYAGKAQLRRAEIFENHQELIKAFNSYQAVIDNYPSLEGGFAKAILGQLRIARRSVELWRRSDIYGHEPDKKKVPKRGELGKLLEVVHQNGKYTNFAPEILYELGIAFQKESRLRSARLAFGEIIDKFPESDFADDASFQLAFIDYLKVVNGDTRGELKADIGLREMIQNYPESEKIAQAKYCLEQLQILNAQRLTDLALFYEKAGNIASAKLYIETVFRDFPEAAQSIDDARVLHARLIEKSE